MCSLHRKQTLHSILKSEPGSATPPELTRGIHSIMLVSQLLEPEKPGCKPTKHSCLKAKAAASEPHLDCGRSSRPPILRIWTIDELKKTPIDSLTYPITLASQNATVELANTHALEGILAWHRASHVSSHSDTMKACGVRKDEETTRFNHDAKIDQVAEENCIVPTTAAADPSKITRIDAPQWAWVDAQHCVECGTEYLKQRFEQFGVISGFGAKSTLQQTDRREYVCARKR
ncbi:hypothetical protein BKA66DRAFT_220687 [Pyrenochaeta sp. MPI-SDFR-AT-0127]|nr:hypothetical protein BKA66DRAFT_220687 [Pyrenochaeta sp. MPI-SDFR-AT-0127]